MEEEMRNTKSDSINKSPHTTSHKFFGKRANSHIGVHTARTMTNPSLIQTPYSKQDLKSKVTDNFKAYIQTYRQIAYGRTPS